jgi:outer membrane protein OmpA-like peptidoglycan-associated protein
MVPARPSCSASLCAALLLLAPPAPAADEAPPALANDLARNEQEPDLPWKPKIYWEHRQGLSVLVGGGAREEMGAGLLGLGTSFRSEFGHVGFQSVLNLGLLIQSDDDDDDNTPPGFWGRAGAAIELFPLIRKSWQPHLGAGPSVSFEVLPLATNDYTGLNVMVVAGLDHLEPDRHDGWFGQVVVDVPIAPLGTPGRTAAFVTFEFGLKFYSRATRVDPIVPYEPPRPPAPTPDPSDTVQTDDTATKTEDGRVRVNVEQCALDLTDPIRFGDNSDLPLDESRGLLDALAATLVQNPELTRVRLEGHTDERGGANYNQELSQRRVDAVIRELVARGVDAARLVGLGFGESQPQHKNANSIEEHAANRRVVFRIIDGPAACVEAKR